MEQSVNQTSPDRPARLVEVAERAMVSLKTASRALNDEPHVATETRERVKQAARELNFTPNPAAIALARSRGKR